MAKKKPKLTPVPDYKPRAGRRPPQAGSSPASDPAAGQQAPPDLSHITEGLRPLAVPVGDLQFDPANAMTHDDANLAAIRGSLVVYGQRKPIVVNRRTHTVEAGNGTLQAALSLNWAHVAAVFVDDDPAMAAGYAIADNRTAQLAEWDKEALDKLLREVSTRNDERLDAMLSDLATELKLVPAEPKDPEPADERSPNASPTLTCSQCGAVIDKP